MTRPLEPGDLLQLRTVEEVTLHPAGELVAFTVTQPDIKTDSYRSQIHFHSDGVRTLATYGHHDSLMRFSPSGSLMAFVRSAPGEDAEVHILNLGDRSLRSVNLDAASIGESGIGDIQWLDEDTLIVLSRRPSAAIAGLEDAELAQRPRVLTGLGGLKEGPGWVTDRMATVQVVSLATGSRTSIGDNDFDYTAIAVSPDRSKVLAIGTRAEDYALFGHDEVHLLDTAGAALQPLADGRGWSEPGWTNDGRPFASTGRLRQALCLSQIWFLDTGSVMCEEEVRFSKASAAASSDVLALGHRGATVTLDRVDSRTKSATTLVGGGKVVSSFAATASADRVVAAISSPTSPAQLWELKDSQLRCLVSFNDALLSELDLVEPEIVMVDSSDGAIVEGFIFRPPASASNAGAAGSNGSRPGLVYIHGGPTSAYELTFFDEFQIAAAAGYVVIAGNPRGSDGYGNAWAESIRGAIGTVDFDDITALSDRLEALPEVDGGRIGIGGGSYGGLMTAWMIGHTDRYRAALVERCVSNFESFSGTSDIGGFFPLALNGVTFESDQAELRRQSPLTYAPNTTCPVLVIHSDSDWRCPLEQGSQLFAAYRRSGIEASMIIFPGENHELSRSGSPRHRMERFGFIHDFYANHLGGATLPATWQDEL